MSGAPPVRASNGVLVLLLSAGVTFALSQTLILPALPTIARDLDASPAAASWLMTGLLLSSSVTTPMAGKLGDLYGRGRILGAIMATFCVGSLLCAMGDSLEVLIAGRVLQGAAGGVFPLAYGVIRVVLPRAQAVTAFGTLSVSLGVGAALGPPLAGVVVQHAGTSAIFWIGIVGALPALLSPWLIRDKPRSARPSLDWPGALALSGSLICLLLALTQGNSWGWTSRSVVLLLTGATGFSALWLWIEARRDEPLIELRVLRARPMALANASAVLSSCGVFAGFIPLAVFAQAPEATGYGFGMSPAQAGLLIAPHGVAVILCARLGGQLCRWIGARETLVAGSIINALASVQLVLAHGHPWMLLLGGAVMGAGQALILPSLANLVVAQVPAEDVGIATGMNAIMRTVGMAIGSAGSAALLTASVASGSVIAAEAGYVATFTLAAATSVAAVAVAAALPRAAYKPSISLVSR